MRCSAREVLQEMLAEDCSLGGGENLEHLQVLVDHQCLSATFERDQVVKIAVDGVAVWSI